MHKEGVAAIKKQGVAVYDSEGDLTTPLINNRECVFVVYENGIAKCVQMDRPTKNSAQKNNFASNSDGACGPFRFSHTVSINIKTEQIIRTRR